MIVADNADEGLQSWATSATGDMVGAGLRDRAYRPIVRCFRPEPRPRDFGMKPRLIIAALLVLGLGGCDRVTELINQQKLNGEAIGAACRHSGRALEDCFQRNPRIAKADIYAGWRQMNEYMTKNKLDVVPPPPDPPKHRSASEGSVEISTAAEPDAAAADSGQAAEAKPKA